MSAAVPNFADKTIWTGDNLDILRGMNSECVDLIYLDPPFNSNQDYAAPVGSKAAGAAFKDTWHLSDLDVAWMGLIADERPATAHVLRTAGITHGKGMQSYLTMMAVRLLEMHRVLKDTGASTFTATPRPVTTSSSSWTPCLGGRTSGMRLYGATSDIQRSTMPATMVLPAAPRPRFPGRLPPM